MKKNVLKKLAVFSAAMTLLMSSMTAFAAETTYTTKKGDNLSKIAKAVYDDATKWREIYESNKDQIKDPNVIYANQTLVIPDLGITTSKKGTSTTNAPDMLPVGRWEYWYLYDGSLSDGTWYGFEYDANGNMIKESYYDDYDETYYPEYAYEYDASGNMIKKYQYVSGRSNSIVNSYLYEYDANGNMIKLSHYEYDYFDEGPVSEYGYANEYDANGNLIKWSEFEIYGDGEVSDIIDFAQFEYDASGNMTKKTHYSRVGDLFSGTYNSDISLSGWTEYEYDANNNMTKEIHYRSDGSLGSWTEYEYDANNNMTREIHYDSDGSLNDWYEYQY